MTKAELVSKISINTGVEKVIAMAVIESMMEEITIGATNYSVILDNYVVGIVS